MKQMLGWVGSRAAGALLAAGAATLCAGPSARAAHSRAARPSRLHASDVAILRYHGSFGEQVYETGYAKGTLPGSMKVHMTFASTVSGSFILYTHGGTIIGHGRAKPHGGGVWESFAGTLYVTGGSGRYAHAHGSARLYGTFNRDTYALKIKTAGTLLF